MSNPVIDLSQVYNIFFNVQNLPVVNPDGVSWNMEKAIMRVVKTDMTDDIGDNTYGQRTKCNFLFFRTIMPAGISPQINSKITDNNGTHWYVSSIENMYFGNVLKLYCESQAGTGVQDEQFPVGTTSTSSSTTTGVPDTCQANGVVDNGIELSSQLRVCAKVDNVLFDWYLENTAMNSNESCAAQFTIDSIITGNVIDIAADATALTGGSAFIKINGSNVTGNFSSTTNSYTQAVTVGDVILIQFSSPTPLIAGAVNAGIKLLPAPTTSTTVTT
jgi:hypothetical protein